MLRDADFDSIKQDNCGDDQGLGFVARMHYINTTGRALLVGRIATAISDTLNIK